MALKKWLAALRGGEYKQGRNRLKAGNKFCCLGVVCDMYAKENKIKWEKTFNESKSLLGERLCLPNEVIKWLGVRSSNGMFNKDIKAKDRYNASLISLNDQAGMSFKEIADFIDEHRKDVFK